MRTEFDEHQMLLRQGLRATWLNMALTGPYTLLHTPRDREILTLVATSPFGVPRDELADRIGSFGSVPVPADAALRRLKALCDAGHLSQRVHGGRILIDLPLTELAWVEEKLNHYAPAASL